VAIGAVVGIKFYLLACFAAILVLMIFAVFGFLEQKVFKDRK